MAKDILLMSEYIVNVSLLHRKLTLSDINKSLNNTVNESTVWRQFIKAGLSKQVAIRKPIIKISKQKLKMDKDNKNWTKQDWQRVLWSDDSKFGIFLRREKDEKFASNCIVPLVKQRGGWVMAWDSFKGLKVGNLIKIEVKTNKADLQRTL